MNVRTGPLRWHGLTGLAGYVAAKLVRWVLSLVWFAVCRPRGSAAVAGAGAAGWALVTHTWAALLVAALVGHACAWWWLTFPSSWRRHGLLRALAWWRAAVVYRRLWPAAMTVADLTQPGPNGTRRLPRLGRVRCLDDVDVVQVRALLGQRGGMWEEAGGMLAHVFGASDVRVHRGDDRRLTLELRRERRGRSWHRTGVLELPAAGR